jgi:hypothetical protein
MRLPRKSTQLGGIDYSYRLARHQWFTPVILATQEAEIRRIEDLGQPGQIVHEILS